MDYQSQLNLAPDVSVGEGDAELRPDVGITGRLGIGGSSLGAGLFVRAAYALSGTHYDMKTAGSEREIVRWRREAAPRKRAERMPAGRRVDTVVGCVCVFC